MAVRRWRNHAILSMAAMGCLVPVAWAIPAFPGADGAARNVSGGRGGIVYHVTKLNSAIDDPLRNDPGTIRYGLNNANFPSGVPRTIVFDVGGVFNLGRLPQAGWDPNGNGWDAQSRLTIGATNITLAGQTAPGTGVIFMGGGLKPQGNNNIIRNITVASGYGMSGWWKPGDPFPSTPGTTADPAGWFPDNTVYDAMDIAGTNLMIDHVSTLYATDETISMNEVANNITVQYSNISQGQNYPQWDAEGGGLTGHALGSLLSAGNSTSAAAISFHHNLYAHQKSRVPQVGSGGLGGYYDFRNNVFYNWFGTAGNKGGTTFLNLVNNFYLAGDGGDNPIGGSNPGLTTQGGGTGVLGTSSSVYRNGNLLDSNKDADANDGVTLSAGGSVNPIWLGGNVTYLGTTDGASQAFDRVLNYMGANWWTRDALINTPDERIIHEARTGTGKIMAWADDPWNSDPAEGTEWRALKNTPQTTRAADWDTEADIGYGIGDGMPSWWELAHGLNPNVRDDTNDFDNDGYTNLEEYLNEIAEWPAPNAIIFNGAITGRYATITSWDANPDSAFTHNWQPSKYDIAKISAGTATVDAVGQHAGVLLVGTESGNAATLRITSGWLRVASVLQVGSTSVGAGTIDLAGGRVSVLQVARIRDTGKILFNGGALDLQAGLGIFDYSSSSPLTTVQAAIASGYNAGAWNGAGINSAVIPTVTAARMALGFAEAGSLSLSGSFWGQSVDPTTVVVAYTFAGDANLDRAVDSQDFNAFLAGYGSPTIEWTRGDFNYDGVVNTIDFNYLAGNFGLSFSSPSPVLGSVVPEPGTCAAVLMLLPIIRRRRR